MQKQHKVRRAVFAISIISAMILFSIIYLTPNVFGHKFLSGKVSPIYDCRGKMVGVELTAINSYIQPVVLSYPGADIVIDIYDGLGTKIHRATFLSDALHDDEEGYSHVARLPPGESTFTLEFTESSQYYRTSKLPSLLLGEYIFVANAFGVDFDSESFPQEIRKISGGRC